MKNNLRFKVGAGLKNILGKDLITSPNIAILELVKNSYDAYATKVDITFDNDKIIIADNGIGMSYDDLINKWLFVAYSAKADGTEARSYRNKQKRHFAGAKGIGRISCDRLAKELRLTTRHENCQTQSLKVDWEKFDKNLKDKFDSIDIPYESFDEIPIFPENGNTGTILEFNGLRDYWNDTEIGKLRRSLEQLINPFSGNDDFSIEVFIPETKVRQLEFAFGAEVKEKTNSLAGKIENSIVDVLKLKTTAIESKFEKGIIKTVLRDRDIVMYEIEEDYSKQDRFDKLQEVSINLMYLNPIAKNNFSRLMNLQPVQYGNVFLFRNGFRLWPYGEQGDDSWGLNRRAQQGYNRFLGTRELFGRVDVETDDIESIKEVSSRDGGLIQTPASNQLFDYFRLIFNRLERYVAGVLWGEGFLKKGYFLNNDIAQQIRAELQTAEKSNETSDHIFKNVGSKVDFLQIIKSFSNDKIITVKYFNKDLTNILSDSSYSSIIQEKNYEEFRKFAESIDDEDLRSQVEDYKKQKEDAERKAEEEKQKRLEAERVFEEERRKRIDAERRAEAERRNAEFHKTKAETEAQKRKESDQKLQDVEKDLRASEQKALYLSATRNTTQEVQDITHTISINSTSLLSLVSTLSRKIGNGTISTDEQLSKIKEIGFFANRIKQLSLLITKADIVTLKAKTKVDLREYIKEYVSNFSHSTNMKIIDNIQKQIWKFISVLDISVVLDNLISNSVKAVADEICIKLENPEDNKIVVFFSDNGEGVNLDIYSPDSIFEEGVTNRRGGSGIGLHTVKYTMETQLDGKIEFSGNGLNNYKGATFKLIFN